MKLGAIVTSYHDVAFEHAQRAKIVQKVEKIVATYPKKVGIVCTGLSGILIGVTVASEMKRAFAIVRKAGEKSHADYEVEGYKMDEYIVVDDFLVTGDTIKRIIRKMNERNDSTCRAIILYRGKSYGRGNVPTFEYDNQKAKIHAL